MPKSMLYPKGVFLKKPCFSLGKMHFFEIQGVEVGSKNRLKNDVENDAETEGLGARKLDFYRFLMDLGAILALQNGAKTLQNRC